MWPQKWKRPQKIKRISKRERPQKWKWPKNEYALKNWPSPPNLFALPPPLINYLIFFLMTSHLDSHTTTNVKSEMLSGVKTGNRIPHMIILIYTALCICVHNRKDYIFVQRWLVQSFKCIRVWGQGTKSPLFCTKGATILFLTFELVMLKKSKKSFNTLFWLQYSKYFSTLL